MVRGWFLVKDLSRLGYITIQYESKEQEILQEFAASNAILKGHFIWPLSLRDTATRNDPRPALRGSPSRMSMGHTGFILSSGLHSETYMQCARVLMEPKMVQKLCDALAQKIEEKLGKNFADIIVAPAMGGVIVSYTSYY